MQYFHYWVEYIVMQLALHFHFFVCLCLVYSSTTDNFVNYELVNLDIQEVISRMTSAIFCITVFWNVTAFSKSFINIFVTSPNVRKKGNELRLCLFDS